LPKIWEYCNNFREFPQGVELSARCTSGWENYGLQKSERYISSVKLYSTVLCNSFHGHCCFWVCLFVLFKIFVQILFIFL
jgi:hypothetical protein